MNKTPISVALERQIPEYVRGEYELFVNFIKAYYEFLDQTQQRNLEDIRSVENTLEEFVIRFKKELSVLFPTNSLENERFILQRIREFYQSRGSKESFQFLFRILFNKDSDIFYPSTQILRASDGKWVQEKSVFVKSQSGNLFNLSGKIIDIQTANKQIHVFCPRVVYYRDDIYEVFIDRAYVQDITISNIVSSQDGNDTGYILPCPNKYTITSEGAGFEIGQLYFLKSQSGDGSLVKITKIGTGGSIKKVQIISFGLDYESTYYAKLTNKQYVAFAYHSPIDIGAYDTKTFIASQGQNTFNVSYTPGHISVYKNNVLLSSSEYAGLSGTSITLQSAASLNDIIRVEIRTPYRDGINGFVDYGYINKQDYFYFDKNYVPSIAADQNAFYADGTYVGEIIGSFYTNASNTNVIDSDTAEIKIELGSVAVYPGYYSASDGFISDESYIQDGKYFQLFSYVIKVEQQIDSYLDIVKELLHPAGLELYAEYTIKNEYLVSASPLLAFIRRQFLEQEYVTDDEATNEVYKNVVPNDSTVLAIHTFLQDIKDVELSIQKYRSDGSLANETDQRRWSTVDPSTTNYYDMNKGSAGDPIENSLVTAVGNFANPESYKLTNLSIEKYRSDGSLANQTDQRRWSTIDAISAFNHDVLNSEDKFEIAQLKQDFQVADSESAIRYWDIKSIEGGTFYQTTSAVHSSLNDIKDLVRPDVADASPVQDTFDRDTTTVVTYDRSLIPLVSLDPAQAVEVYYSLFTPAVKADTYTVVGGEYTTGGSLVNPEVRIGVAYSRAPDITLSGTVTNGSNIITLTSGTTDGIITGRVILKTSGTGTLAAGTVRVSDILSSTTFKMTDNATGTGTITFTLIGDVSDLAGNATSVDSHPTGNDASIDGQIYNFPGVQIVPGKFLLSGGSYNKTVTSSDSFNIDRIIYDRSIIPLATDTIPAIDAFPTGTDAAIDGAIYGFPGIQIIPAKFLFSGVSWRDTLNSPVDSVPVFTWPSGGKLLADTINNTNTGLMYVNAYNQDTSDPNSSYSYEAETYSEHTTRAIS